jgi:hypothetical protein
MWPFKNHNKSSNIYYSKLKEADALNKDSMVKMSTISVEESIMRLLKVASLFEEAAQSAPTEENRRDCLQQAETIKDSVKFLKAKRGDLL